MYTITYKTKTLLFVLTTFAIVLGACAPMPAPVTEAPAAAEPTTTEPAPAPTEEMTPEVMTFTDDLGVTLEYTEYPQSIVSLSPSTTEILFAIGAGNQTVGRDEMSLFPEEALALTNVGAMWEEVPAEAILALEPDLVIAAQIINEDQVQALRDLGLNVYWQANPANYEELWENMRNIAALTGHEVETEALITDLDARVKAVEEKIAPLSNRPSVFYELDATDPSAPWTTGSGTFIDYIITTAGGVNAASALEGDYAQISVEELLAVDPQIILLADAPYGVTPESVAARAGWNTMTAVTENAIYPIDPNIMSVPGPRLVDALEETANILHPGVLE